MDQDSNIIQFPQKNLEDIPDIAASDETRKYFRCRCCDEVVMVYVDETLPSFFNTPGSCPRCWEINWHADAL